MRLQVLDESIRTACQECTLCCTQSLRVLVKVEKAHMLDTYDFSKYPQLAGKQYFKKSTDGREDVYEIAKHEDMHCIFCDTDDLCIIHKELGPEAKPRMCRQFPILESRTPVDDRISASYACPAVQAFDGEALTEKASDIAELVPLTDKPMDFDARVPLDATFDLSWIESNALFDRVRALFDPDRHADLWTRFGDVLALLVAVRAYKDDAPENTGQNELIDIPAAERGAGTQMATDLRIKTHGLGLEIGSLSGGNQQKVVIARCLMTGPRVLLLDEPTRGVDVGAKREIHSIIRRLAEAGMGVILVSSELEEVRATAHRIVVMSRGAVTAEFDASEATDAALALAASAGPDRTEAAS